MQTWVSEGELELFLQSGFAGRTVMANRRERCYYRQCLGEPEMSVEGQDSCVVIHMKPV